MSRPLVAPASLCAGAEKAGGWVAQGWFLPGKGVAQSAGDIGSRRVSWSVAADPGCGEGCAGIVGGRWQGERKQRQVVSFVQGDVCAITAASPATRIRLLLSK